MTAGDAELLAVVDPAVLGGRLKSARLAQRLTQTQLADGRASVADISRIESGHQRPELAVLRRLAARLEVPVVSLLTGVPEPSLERVRFALEHAELALRGGAVERARDLLTEIDGLLPDAGDDGLRAQARFLDALCAEAEGDLDRAIVGLEDLLQGGDSPDVTRYAIALSRCYRESGDLSRAIATGDECLRTLREHGLHGSDDAVQLAVTVAAAHFVIGDVAHAVRMCKRAIEEAETLGTPVALASAYWNAGVMESERGAPDAAIPLAEKALHLMEEVEGSRNLARLRSQLGIFQLRLDPPDVAGARENLEAAARQFDWSSASPIDRGRNLLALARAKLVEGHSHAAMQDAADILVEVRDKSPLLAVGALLVMGQASYDEANIDRAISRYRDAVAMLSGIGSDRSAAECWFELGALLDGVGLVSEARDAYRSAAASTGLTSWYATHHRRQLPY